MLSLFIHLYAYSIMLIILHNYSSIQHSNLEIILGLKQIDSPTIKHGYGEQKFTNQQTLPFHPLLIKEINFQTNNM